MASTSAFGVARFITQTELFQMILKYISRALHRLLFQKVLPKRLPYTRKLTTFF